MEFTTNSAQETESLAQQLASKIENTNCIALYGDLGVGKTTLTRYLVASLGFTARVQSPTFVIARRYSDAPTGRFIAVNHIDLYRFSSAFEVRDLGLEEFLEKPNELTLIEWPELAEDVLPVAAIRIHIEDLGGDKRKFTIEGIADLEPLG
jgi:tRNA threonylcarbamoyl adenosine modification protein YjeE